MSEDSTTKRPSSKIIEVGSILLYPFISTNQFRYVEPSPPRPVRGHKAETLLRKTQDTHNVPRGPDDSLTRNSQTPDERCRLGARSSTT